MTHGSTQLVAIAAMVLSLPSMGCRTTNLSASTLPPEMRAPSGAGRQRIELRGMDLAGGTSSAVGPADLLEVAILTGLPGDEGEPQLLRVGDDGVLEVPYIGSVEVAGVDPTDVAQRIQAAAVQRGIYRQPQVNVRIEEQATYRVTVLGAVTEPGVQEVPRRGCDVLGAIAAAGGFTDDAGTVVEVLRYGDDGLLAEAAEPQPANGIQQVAYQTPTPRQPVADTLDLARLSKLPPARQRLGDRDVLVVRPREKRVVHVSGLVAQPDQFELTEDHDLRLLDAIAMAGGVTSSVADKALLIRQVPNRAEPAVVAVSLSEAKRNGAENLV
ncbi:MAG: SLBB domain-containing protein, partial [Planctomycetota bacterium]